MALPAPTFVAAHGVLGLPDAVTRDPGRDEKFIHSARGEFPNVVNRQLLPPEAPPPAPHLTLASSSSQLALSAAQADFQVRFYADYQTDIERALDYVERKLIAVRAALVVADMSPSMIGVIGTLHFSGEEINGESPAAHILQTHLRADVDPDQLQDALARVGLKVRDTYFVTLTMSNYEFRVLERPLMPGVQAIRLRPWEGRIEDTGLELAVDINNNLEARSKRHDPVVTDDGIRAVLALLRQVARDTGPTFAETGKASVADLVDSSATSSSA